MPIPRRQRVFLCDGQVLTSPTAVKNWFRLRRAALVTRQSPWPRTLLSPATMEMISPTNANPVTLVGSSPD